MPEEIVCRVLRLPVSRVAARWNLSVQTVRRIDKRIWRFGVVDEIFWKKGGCLTVVSDLEAGELREPP